MAAHGLRFGEKGTHTSRTIMLAEISDLLAAVPTETSAQEGYLQAVIHENLLGKQTTSNRRLTGQRLRELYALDPRLPIFRVLRCLWQRDKAGRPLIAMLCALARDPLLRATRSAVLNLPVGKELIRGDFLEVIQDAVGTRLNQESLEHVARNAASSWSQSGHLKGRVRKIRQRVTPTPGALAMALWLGTVEGLTGQALLESRWARVLDHTGLQLEPMVLQAKRLNLINARLGGDVVEIDTSRIDPVQRDYSS